jgi:hypothetical protein
MPPLQSEIGRKVLNIEKMKRDGPSKRRDFLYYILELSKFNEGKVRLHLL